MLNPLLNQALSNQSTKYAKAQMRRVCIDIISNTNDTDLAMLSHIIGIKNTNKVCFISQMALGNKQGRVRKTANRVTTRLHNMGLIIKTYRPNKTCIYTPNPLLEHPYVRRWLSKAVKAFNFFNISLLLSSGQLNNPLVKNPYIYSQEHYTQEMSHEEDNRYLYQSDTSKNSTPKTRILSGGPSPGTNEAHRRVDKPQGVRRDTHMTSNKRIKGLKLTRAGEIKLSPFPKEIRDLADKDLQAQKKHISNPLRFYAAICKKYCDQRGIKTEWHSVFSMLDREGFHIDDPGVDLNDPYEYEVMKVLTSDNRPKHGPLSIATPPKLVRQTPEQISLLNDALAHGAKSSKALYDAGYWASILLGP